MPWLPDKQCPGQCGRIVKAGSPGCDSCRSKKQEQIEVNRGSSHSRGYDKVWRRLRKLVLHRDKVCRGCGKLGTPSDNVDHIISKEDGGRDSLINLQRLCHRCHSKKTAKTDSRWGKRRFGGPVKTRRMGDKFRADEG